MDDRDFRRGNDSDRAALRPPGRAAPRRETDGISRFAATIGVIAALALAVSACSSGGDEPDVSDDGQIEYACALADHVGADADISSWTLIGDDADEGARAVGAMASLAGGSAMYIPDGHESLAEAGKTLFEGLSTADVESMQEGLQDFTEQCADVADASDADVSAKGQVAYACALAGRVADERDAVDDWGVFGEERAWHESMSIGALFGALNGQVLADHTGLSDAGRELVSGVVRVDVDQVQTGLEDINAQCEDVDL